MLELVAAETAHTALRLQSESLASHPGTQISPEPKGGLQFGTSGFLIWSLLVLLGVE